MPLLELFGAFCAKQRKSACSFVQGASQKINGFRQDSFFLVQAPIFQPAKFNQWPILQRTKFNNRYIAMV
jgi:hypothetical protein